ncbi:18618_t:CDS:2, partial [Entrophospora sp. SA101]
NATNCSVNEIKETVFGWLMGSLYCGFSIGPMIAGWISQATGNIMSLSIFLPASKNNRNNEESKVLGRYALLNSAIITFFTSFAIYGIQAVFLLYISLVFKLSVVEQGYLLFVIGGARDLIEEESEESKLRLKGELLKLEIWVIRIGLFIEAACMTLYGIISSGVALIGVAVTASLGSTAFPTLKSFQTNLLQLHHQYVLIRCIVYLSPDLLHILYEEGGIGYEISDGEYVDDDDINVVIDVIDGPVVNWYWLEYD